MKTPILTSLIILTLSFTDVSAQETSTENYGNTLNMGIGIGYYGYISNAMPVVHANYEFEVARNFTLAPFITYFSYRNYYYW